VPSAAKRARQKEFRRQRLEEQRRLRRRRQLMRRIVIILVVAAAVVTPVAILSSSSTTTTTTTTTSSTTTTTIPAKDVTAQKAANKIAVRAGCPASPYDRVNKLTWKSAPKVTINTKGIYYAHITSTAGTFVIKLDAAEAPKTVNNFIFLAHSGYFNCNIFMRVVPNFIIQTGDPTGTQQGSPGYTIPDELPKASSDTYPTWSVAMANGGANTGGSQFFIVTSTAGGKSLTDSYSLFGTVIKGISALQTVNSQGTQANDGHYPLVIQRMLKVTITTTP
jgi:peptidyl-prolyl cis-trans isomerase B (cyclophilin B)